MTMIPVDTFIKISRYGSLPDSEIKPIRNRSVCKVMSIDEFQDVYGNYGDVDEMKKSSAEEILDESRKRVKQSIPRDSSYNTKKSELVEKILAAIREYCDFIIDREVMERVDEIKLGISKIVK